MTENTKIEWADHTFNPWTGCTKVSPGCDHCYAEGWSKRAGAKVGKWGPGAPRVRTNPRNWLEPLKWNAAHDGFYAQHGRRQRVFCASLADVFDNEVSDAWRQDLMMLIAETPHLDWLLLTKRVGNVGRMLDEATLAGWDTPWSNVWIGATIVNQEEAVRDIPKLLATPAANRFLSMEPLLGPVDLTLDGLVCTPCRWCAEHSADPDTGVVEHCRRCEWSGKSDEWGIDWVIVGGESGPGARPMHPDWARSLRDQCVAAGVPFLFKQWGEWLEVDSEARDENGNHIELDPDSHDGREMWDAKTDTLLTIDGRQFIPETLPDDTAGRLMTRLGKKAAGRLLDGRTWDDVPA